MLYNQAFSGYKNRAYVLSDSLSVGSSTAEPKKFNTKYNKLIH